MSAFARVELPLLAIDPGRNVGWAKALGGRLVEFGTVSNVRWDESIDALINALPSAVGCVVEMPRVYPNARKWKGDPQHIVRLAYLAGRIGERFPAAIEVEPRTWMGGSPPDRVLRARTTALLRPAELALVESRRLSSHAWDAIGLLLYSLNRRI